MDVNAKKTNKPQLFVVVTLTGHWVYIFKQPTRLNINNFNKISTSMSFCHYQVNVYV